jgi:hypothetical protein
VQTTYERVTSAIDLLTEGLYPYVEQELKSVYDDGWHDAARDSFRKGREHGLADNVAIKWDAHALLTVMWDQWNHVFRRRLSHTDRSLVSELREFRNQWAHQTEFNFDDAYRVLDDVQRLLKSIGASNAGEIADQKRELLREEFSKQQDAISEHSEFHRRKWRFFAIYIACCFLIVAAIFSSFGWSAWYLAALVIITFGYFSQQLFATKPRLSGPHECKRCRRIIYAEPCPYCEVTPQKTATA